MPLDIRLEPYMLESVLVRDSYLTHYQATGAGRVPYVATEFYPTYMADRQPNGTLKISDRFTKEFQDELDSFRRRAEAMNEVSGAILPIDSVVENNNTAYVIRRQCPYTTIENYMQGQKMDYIEAFHFIRPLLISLGQAQVQGVVFTFSIKDLRVSPSRELMLDAMFSWDLNFHPCITELARLYFKLITGGMYSAEKPSVAEYGVTVPPRLEGILTEILSGADILYGSIDDFHRKIKYELDLEAGAAAASSNTTSAKLMAGASKVLFVLVAIALAGMVYGGILAYRNGSSWANPRWFAEGNITTPDHDFTQIAITHPRDTSDIITGTFHFYDIFLFYRSDWGRPVLARRSIEERALQMPGVVATEEEIIFVDNVKPSSIQSWKGADNSHIFFIDGLSNNAIYRANVYGAPNLTRISDHRAMHMTIVGDVLFYSNFNDNNNLYRINLNTLETRLALTMPIHGLTTDGERLFILSGEPGGPFNVFTSYPESPAQLRHLATNAGLSMFYNPYLEAIFFNTTEGHVRGVTPEGELILVPYWNQINAHSFTMDANWLIFTEPGRLQPRAIHVRLGDRVALDGGYWLSYIWARNGVLYGLDHVNPMLSHMIQIPEL